MQNHQTQVVVRAWSARLSDGATDVPPSVAQPKLLRPRERYNWYRRMRAFCHQTHVFEPRTLLQYVGWRVSVRGESSHYCDVSVGRQEADSAQRVLPRIAMNDINTPRGELRVCTARLQTPPVHTYTAPLLRNARYACKTHSECAPKEGVPRDIQWPILLEHAAEESRP
jgi:hypothetical protein